MHESRFADRRPKRRTSLAYRNLAPAETRRRSTDDAVSVAARKRHRTTREHESNHPYQCRRQTGQRLPLPAPRNRCLNRRKCDPESVRVRNRHSGDFRRSIRTRTHGDAPCPRAQHPPRGALLLSRYPSREWGAPLGETLIPPASARLPPSIRLVCGPVWSSRRFRCTSVKGALL